ncbi:MAG TPA: two-component regulator propeller domain-containing protein, partial [Saprospiraceae bacterium]|nr:two-component regulator propeller domain-containing protein [Saprospiraceae bacterium]
MELIRPFSRGRPLASLLTLAFGLVVELAMAQLPAVSFQHLKRDENLFSSLYVTIAEDQNGFIWFGSSNGGGLYRYDGYELRSFLPDPNQLQTSIAGTRISRIIDCDDHQLMVGTYFGFSFLDPFTGRIKS